MIKLSQVDFTAVAVSGNPSEHRYRRPGEDHMVRNEVQDRAVTPRIQAVPNGTGSTDSILILLVIQRLC